MATMKTGIYAGAEQPEITVKVFLGFVSLTFSWEGSELTIFVDTLADAAALKLSLSQALENPWISD